MVKPSIKLSSDIVLLHKNREKKCCGVIKTKKYVTLYVTVVLNQTQMCIWLCNC